MSKQQNQWVLLAAILLLSLTAVFSCKHEIPGPNNNGGSGSTTDPCDPSIIYFRQQVLPILVSNCAKSGCHDETTHKEGIITTSYATIIATGDIKPGRPGESDLYKEIINGKMPPAGNTPLTQQQKNLIYNWIAQGAKDLICENMCDSSSFTFSTAIKNIISTKCQGCHSGTSAGGGIDLTAYTGVKAQVTNGKLWGSINFHTGYSPMPKNGSKLSDCELAQIRKWIDAGALNN
jgi:uncharacterized membrane protein